MTYRSTLVRIFAAGLFLVSFAAPVASQPNNAEQLDIDYELAFWGIPFGHTTYSGSFLGDTYAAKAHFETSGLVSAFWKSTIDATAGGKINAHALQPAVYDSYSANHSNKIQRVRVDFESTVPITFAEPAYDTSQYPVTDEQKKGALDPMSAITFLLTKVPSQAGKACSSGVHVFDGRRRYNVSLSYLRDETITLGHGLFSGTTHLCQIHFEYIAGYKQKIIKDGQSLPPMFANFIDIPDAQAPNGYYSVAVKLFADLPLGSVVVTLTNLKLNGVDRYGPG